MEGHSTRKLVVVAIVCALFGGLLSGALVASRVRAFERRVLNLYELHADVNPRIRFQPRSGKTWVLRSRDTGEGVQYRWVLVPDE